VIARPRKGLLGGKLLSVRGSCRVNNSVMLRELLLAGLGLTLAPEFVVRDLLNSGGLVEVLSALRPHALTIFGVAAHQRYVAHKVRVFMDFVSAQLADADFPHAVTGRYGSSHASQAG
jgi:DNA-binding transcriptional LysR family regulator